MIDDILMHVERFEQGQKQPPEVFSKKAVLKNALNIHRKIPGLVSFLNKVAGLGTFNLLNRDSNTGVFLLILPIF